MLAGQVVIEGRYPERFEGVAAAFVERIDGSVTNVIGLPLAETLATLCDALASIAD